MPISTYLCHSYRSAELEINRHFWDRLGAHDFSFIVDPPSTSHQTVHLERRMLQSQCFIAVVPFREDAAVFRASPFMLYEIGLALQFRRPMLVLYDHRIGSATPFFQDLEEADSLVFEAEDPAAVDRLLEFKLSELKRRALPGDYVRRTPSRLIGVVPSGDLAPGSAAYGAILAAAESQGFHIRAIEQGQTHNALFLQTIDTFDAVVMDARAGATPSWMIASLLFRPVPTVKTVCLRNGKGVADTPLEPLINGTRMDEDEPAPEHLVFHRCAEDLEAQLAHAFSRVGALRPNLMDKDSGVSYFHSLGRPKTRVFLSNSGAQNELVDHLLPVFERFNIELFHYKKDIDAGELWRDRLEHELNVCDGMIAIIDAAYWDSQWCKMELEQGMARRAADDGYYFSVWNVGNANVSSLGKWNARDLDQDDPVAVAGVVQRLDSWLRKRVDPAAKRQRFVVPGGTTEWLIDVLRRTPPEALIAAGAPGPLAKVRLLDGEDGPANLSRHAAEQIIKAFHSASAHTGENRHPLVAFLDRLHVSQAVEHREELSKLLARLRTVKMDVPIR